MASSSIGRALRRVRAGDRRSITRAEALRTPAHVSLTSTAFTEGAAIPRTHAARPLGDNLSPALSWGELPPGAAQLVLVVEDVDAPLPRPILHTIALLDPAPAHLAEGDVTVENARVRFVPATFGRRGYAGPRPIPGHGPHHYGFHLYVLDRMVPAEIPLRGSKDLLAAAAGHVIAAGHLTGTYERA